MKKSPHSLISAYCVVSLPTWLTTASKLALYACPEAVSRCGHLPYSTRERPHVAL